MSVMNNMRKILFNYLHLMVLLCRLIYVHNLKWPCLLCSDNDKRVPISLVKNDCFYLFRINLFVKIWLLPQLQNTRQQIWYTLFHKNQAAWYFVRPTQAVTWRTVAIIIRVVLVSPYLWIRGVSLSSIHYNQSRRAYINQRHQYIRLIWS